MELVDAAGQLIDRAVKQMDGVVADGPEAIQLVQDGVRPDVASSARLHWLHRTAGDAEIYFVASPAPHDVAAPVAFRTQ